MNDLTKTILAGIVGTLAMTILMMVAAMMGMPKMSPPDMLAGMTGTSTIVGWIMHFMIGILFAAIYVYVISGWLTNISSIVLRGLVFGIIAFVIAQVAMMLMGNMLDMPQPEGSMMLRAIGSLMGHLVFGIVVALIAKK